MVEHDFFFFFGHVQGSIEDLCLLLCRPRPLFKGMVEGLALHSHGMYMYMYMYIAPLVRSDPPTFQWSMFNSQSSTLL